MGQSNNRSIRQKFIQSSTVPVSGCVRLPVRTVTASRTQSVSAPRFELPPSHSVAAASQQPQRQLLPLQPSSSSSSATAPPTPLLPARRAALGSLAFQGRNEQTHSDRLPAYSFGRQAGRSVGRSATRLGWLAKRALTLTVSSHSLSLSLSLCIYLSISLEGPVRRTLFCHSRATSEQHCKNCRCCGRRRCRFITLIAAFSFVVDVHKGPPSLICFLA